ncbi:protein gamma response 1 isoform X2 [Momordica charantia]|uniref:Protein gamma response 1 isoform X2 n=1 Tax=Momordica charantia TaxID=3673 RepID=A0A6J1DA85_MOMCH|nr:protein gamma response 1 isoform X2 [Momordica charantia]
MDSDQDHSLKLGGSPVDSDDLKYISGLSTILVATIQETKDRISQIEYIFCNQIFPSFQAKSKSLQKLYSDARKFAEDAWKDKETDLLFQIEKLKRENQLVHEENQSLKLEKEKPSKEQEERMDLLRSKLLGEQLKVEELSQQLKQKSREIDEGIELQRKLLEMVRSKTSLIMGKEQKLKEHEDQSNALRSKLTSLEMKVDELQRNLSEKTDEVSRVKKLEENLFKKLELQASEIMNIEKMNNDQQKEKQILVVKLEKLQENLNDLQKKLFKKTEEIEEGRKLQTKLLQQIDSAGSEISKNKEQLEEFEKEKKLLLAKLNASLEKINELKSNPKVNNNEEMEGNESYESLRQQIESKSYKLLAEKKARKGVVDAYKRLKSQHNFLLKKFGLTSNNMLKNIRENETDSMANNLDLASSPDPDAETEEPYMAVSDPCQLKKEIGLNSNIEDTKGVKRESSPPKAPTFPIGSKRSPNVKAAPVASKRSASCWRDTRAHHQAQVGPDPHDDFLDTPFENIRENLNNPVKDGVQDLPLPDVGVKDIIMDRSDDETQDMNAAHPPENPQAGNGRGSFKFLEPVRKKADRQNLKGIECKQCKKFYDAVLPNDGNGETNGDKPGLRCEHHDGVSRHRYRYVPPMTPEGFWNIGFESEM